MLRKVRLAITGLIRASHCLYYSVILAGCILNGRVTAHPPNAEGRHETADSSPAQLVLPRVDGPKPWSAKPTLNDPRRFQIAIVTDRTGGHRPGIWMKGVRKLNLLRPEFVVSVGDLIEGYTDDRAQVEREWNEFTGFIDQLEMKFFFVAGNHDLTNPMMHEIWRKRFGPEWYSFNYKGVHFVCLNSEDSTSQLGEQQLKWVEADLAAHADARWTLIFLHKPLWAYADRERSAGNEDRTGWSRVETALGDRPRTVFAGHHHSYVQFDRRGRKYYQLATMGGGSQLRGTQYGEFDHFVWLTMEPSGPHVTNVMLDGIFPADVVTEKSITRFRDFLAKPQIEVAPILLESDAGFQAGRIDLRLTNQYDQPIEVEGQLAGIPLQGLTLSPESIRITAAKGETTEQAFEIRFNERMPYSKVAGTVFTAKIRSVETPSFTAERSIPVVIDRRYKLVQLTSAKLDASLDEWTELRYGTTGDSQVLGASQFYNGEGDASFKFDVGYDDRNLYIAARVHDDKRLPGDRFDVVIDTRPIAQRAGDSRLRVGSYRVQVDAPRDSGAANARVLDRRGRRIEQPLEAKAVVDPAGGYVVEIALPLEIVQRQQGQDWHSLQLTTAVRDVDEPQEAASQILWRGSEGFDQRNTGFAHFGR